MWLIFLLYTWPNSLFTLLVQIKRNFSLLQTSSNNSSVCTVGVYAQVVTLDQLQSCSIDGLLIAFSLLNRCFWARLHGAVW